MGTRGPKSKHPSGVGYITEQGYHRQCVWDPASKTARAVLVHVLIWERVHGAIPDGFQVHHVNRNRQDNRIENLECVDPTTHKRLHSGCEIVDGVWWKPCKLCGERKPIDQSNWYLSREGWPQYGRCRRCHIAKVIVAKRERAQRRRRAGEGG